MPFRRPEAAMLSSLISLSLACDCSRHGQSSIRPREWLAIPPSPLFQLFHRYLPIFFLVDGA
ncbi:hypothetical protein BDV28DRAFT_131474 [Aspergillus coremiiformis]|uniref:Secreted protein n=1 Tax=Aspergillus coremiiformis TaxID=138285 RepID=A0A5N6Z990_9EURO|nr:hypothetical protein BDV28DRAFT_131474 [Aspergillus coremiiformis]